MLLTTGRKAVLSKDWGGFTAISLWLLCEDIQL